MSVSTNGQMCYGCLLEEEVELPWDTEEFDHDIEAWWRSVNGYVPPCDPWTPEGNYAPGWSKDDPRFREYYDHKHAWEKEHPILVELVNACSGEYPLWIVAVPSTVKTARRGDPTRLGLDVMADPDVSEENGMREFLNRYEIPHDADNIGWWLSSYWG